MLKEKNRVNMKKSNMTFDERLQTFAMLYDDMTRVSEKIALGTQGSKQTLINLNAGEIYRGDKDITQVIDNWVVMGEHDKSWGDKHNNRVFCIDTMRSTPFVEYNWHKLQHFNLANKMFVAFEYNKVAVAMSCDGCTVHKALGDLIEHNRNESVYDVRVISFSNGVLEADFWYNTDGSKWRRFAGKNSSENSENSEGAKQTFRVYRVAFNRGSWIPRLVSTRVMAGETVRNLECIAVS